MKKLLTALLVVLSTGAARRATAAGFAVDTQGGRGTGMASAVTADVEDASAIYYNPAGIAQGERMQLQLGATGIIPFNTFSPTGGGADTSAKVGLDTPITGYAVYGLNDTLSVGIGLFNGYGLALEWPADWPGRQVITSSDLKTYNINPTIGFRPMERVRVGVGLQIVRGTVSLAKAVNFVDSEGTVEIAGGAWGAGGNAGIQVEILPKQLSFGAAYRSAVSLDFAGKAHFDGVPAEFATTAKDQGVSTSVTLPDTLALGLAYKPLDKLLIGVDADYTAWQRFSELAITFDDPALSSVQRKAWKYVWNFHVGGEYAVNDQIHARAGVMYDPTPTPPETLTPDIPDANRINLALGGGYAWNHFNFDLGYQFVILTSNTSTSPVIPGTYKGSAQLVGLSVTYTWGGEEKAAAKPEGAKAESAHEATPVPVGAAPTSPIETTTAAAPPAK